MGVRLLNFDAGLDLQLAKYIKLRFGNYHSVATYMLRCHHDKSNSGVSGFSSYRKTEILSRLLDSVLITIHPSCFF